MLIFIQLRILSLPLLYLQIINAKMTYQEALDYMFSRLPMFSRIGGEAIKNGFTNILALCELLGNPHQKGKFIHIAGTNGKGSVSHMLAAVLQTAGYKTGLYTSPHLKDVRERIKINGQMIEEADVVAFLEKIKPQIDRIKPSFFEITVAMAFDHFATNNTDIAVIETGLGGRLDSTNIINPILSVITNIGYDHMQQLGNKLNEIAQEKAGIIKSGVPVIIGEWHDETEEVFFDIAREKNTALHIAEKDFHVTSWEYENDSLLIEVAEKNKPDHKKYHLDLTGSYQIKNILPVLASCRELNRAGFNITEETLVKALKQTKKLTGLHGRWETIHQHPRVTLDVAHNEDGMRQLVNQLEITSYHHLHIILGMVKDKDVENVLCLLPKGASYYFTNAHVPRALAAAALMAKAAENGLFGQTYPDVNTALKQAKAHAHPDDLVLVCGSVFLVGEVQY